MRRNASKLLIILLIACNIMSVNGEFKNDGIMQDKLIDRELFFGNPDKTAIRISPDAKYISYIAPHEGVLNVWVAPSSNLSNAKIITFDKSRGIRNYFWSKNSKYIIYGQDEQGDENWRLYSVNIDNLENVALTPEKGIKAKLVKLSDEFPNEILVMINSRVPEYFDIFKINIGTGKSELFHKNTDGDLGFVIDDSFNIRASYKMLPSGEGEVYLFTDNNIKSKTLLKKIAVEDMLNTGALHVSRDASKLFMLDSEGRNTSALVEIDLKSLQKRTVFESSESDIDDYMVDVKTKMIQAVAVNFMRKKWNILDDSVRVDMSYLLSIEDGEVEIISRDSSDEIWVVAYLKSDSPVKYYLYERKNKEAKFIFVSNKALDELPLAKMYPIKIKSRDGMELICYLTVPRWLDDGSGIPKEPIPMVLNVHGGPNVRDNWGYKAEAQWLANRGYASLYVNYRGSTGFGKEFVNAGDGEWGAKMQDDLEDAVNWAIDKKIALKDKVVIMGGSYGGYATLVGMTKTPNFYAAGIDIVGPSNLETLMKSIPLYWKPFFAHMKKMIGASYETKQGKEFLKERSPVTHAHKIKKPLLIVHGANDQRVKQDESDQIVRIMKENDIPVIYLLYSDEGHGLARPENRFSMYAYAELFLAKFIGGRYLDHDNSFPKSSIKIIEGEDILKAL